MRFVGFFLVLCMINIPIIEAVPIVEVFVNGETPSKEILPENIISASENGDLELIVWYTNQNHPLHITAATERAQDLNAQNEDIFIQGVFWDKSNQNFPNDLESINLDVEVKQNDDGSLILKANTTLENELNQTVVLQWLLLKKTVPVSKHPIGPVESNVVSYHSWDSNINRTKGAENQWVHQIDVDALASWNIENEDLIVVVSLISLDSKEVQGSGSSEVTFSQIEQNRKGVAISLLLIFAAIIGSILVIQSERKRQQDMPLIRPLIKNKIKNGEEVGNYFIGITTRKAAIRGISIEGNGFWRCSANEIPQEIPPKTKREIKIRQTTKEKIGPCTIRLEVDGHERWVLDIMFPESNLMKRNNAEES